MNSGHFRMRRDGADSRRHVAPFWPGATGRSIRHYSGSVTKLQTLGSSETLVDQTGVIAELQNEPALQLCGAQVL